MQRKIHMTILPLLNNSLFHRGFSSKSKVLHPVLCPQLLQDAKVVIPVSMVRYEKDKEKFDTELSALFQYMANKLEQEEIQSVDILATTALHEDWPDSKIAEIDDHFFNKHAKIAKKQMKFLLWKDWIKQRGEQIHQKYYEEVLELSKEGSEWYKLMLNTHSRVSIGSSLEISLSYQRKEYAAIRAMNYYTDLVYMGHISSAWSYLYELYPNIPRFVRVSMQPQASQIKNYDADAAVKIVTASLEQIVSSPNFPPKQKEQLKEICHNLFRTYTSTGLMPHHGYREGVLSDMRVKM